MLKFTSTLPAIPLHQRVIVIALVILLHLVILAFWLMRPSPVAVVGHEMSVSIAVQPAEVAEAMPVAKPLPVAAHALPKMTPIHQIMPAPPIQKIADVAVPIVAAAAAPVLPSSATSPSPAPLPSISPDQTSPPVVAMQDSEPDYQARYLNNPYPAYPIVAHSMGWQGRVILNVQVMSDGSCGSVSLYRSSGHQMLDNAAINTVKNWRFIPARHAGGAVTQWFKVPVNFSIKDNAA